VTPTYHVFDAYQVHQGARALAVTVEAPSLPVAVGDQRAPLPGLMGSASMKDGVLTVSFVNPHASFPLEVEIVLPSEAREVSGSVLTHEDLAAHNTFEEPGVVAPAPLDAGCLRGNTYVAPAASVNVIRFWM